MNKKHILAWLNHHNLTLGSTESLTGGLFASSAVDIPGASNTYKGSIIAYAKEVKVALVKVKEETINTYGIVSSKTAMEMAEGGQAQLGVDYCISFTGNAGPGVQDSKAVGEVFIGLAFKDQCIVEHFNFNGTRNEIRKATVNQGWEILERVIKEQDDDYLLIGENKNGKRKKH